MILNVLAFIRENYGQEITLTDAASCCGVTPEYLSRVFTHEMGVNYSSFLQNFRVSIAKQLLLSGKYKVYEVSEAVGFHDQKYFTKVFKKLCGVTPAEYKRENVR
ncbi:MAG TPA: helix-turn-helix transcriptional regulator [Candidatus Pelethocola excrementipullorum]|nr:helix-turn-helix transcriptional regulator [Candidatus Pelethocola excrementipullorum]